jgi:conjugal transfer pilus assembly protein TraB
MTVIDSLKDKYKNLSQKDKSKIKKLIFFATIFVLIVLTYATKNVEIQQQAEQQKVEQIKKVDLTDAEIFESDILDELHENNRKVEEQMDSLKQENQNLKQMIELNMLQSSQINEQGSNNPYPPAPYQADSNTDNQNYENQMQPQWIGGIIHEEFEFSKDEIKTDVNQKKRTIKLPPGFMKGYLLTGMDAMTIEGSNDNPEPMMIRVQAPAVLPNDVKANLEGCFVIAEGYGNLATHRVDARLRSLTCIDAKGGSVIFEQVKGYIQDADGKRGLRGQPVHRAGALISRSMVAGIFDGLGTALSNSAQTTNISALGEVSTANTDATSLRNAALGGGISAGAKDVRSLFLQLAQQSSPVIEVGAAKKISVVITDLVELKIQEL